MGDNAGTIFKNFTEIYTLGIHYVFAPRPILNRGKCTTCKINYATSLFDNLHVVLPAVSHHHIQGSDQVKKIVEIVGDEVGEPRCAATKQLIHFYTNNTQIILWVKLCHHPLFNLKVRNDTFYF